MTGLIDFSTDAASNDVGAPPILFSEGQPAGTVNNSAREMMAALARWRDDNSGVLAVAGVASNAILLGTNQILKPAQFASAFEVAFRAGEANTGPCTLNVDGIGARPLRRHGGYALAPSDIVPGRVYRARWTFDLPYYVLAGPEVSGPGAIRAFATAQSLPPGWLACDGREVSRTAYEGLFSVIGGAWGAGNSSTTFNIPDLRGRSLFGDDAMGGRGGAGRLTGAGGLSGTIGSQGGAEVVALSAEQMPSHIHGATIGAAGGHDHGGLVTEAGQHSHGGSTAAVGEHTHTGTVDANGLHGHNGTTSTGGAHVHDQGYSVNVAGSGSTNRVVTDLSPTGGENGIGQSKSAGNHNHTFRTDADGTHAHTFTSNPAGSHAHGIGADGAHRHAIPGVGDHTHALAIVAAGAGAAHPTMPPGAVVIWAIRA